VKAEMKAITSKGDTAASERLGNLHFVNGDLSLRKGKAKQATVFYKQAVEAFEAALGKTHAKTLTAKLLYAQTATNDESANMAGEVGKSAPSDSSLQLLGTATEAGLRWNKGDKEKARASFASLSGKTDVFHEAALSAQRRGRVQAAMLYFRAAIETAADDANKFEYTAELAALHYSTDELDKAVSYFNEVADYQKAQSTTSVEYLKACNNVVDALRIQGKTEEALKIAQQSIKACEQNAGKNSLAILVAYNNVARLKRDSGNTNGAIKDYTRVLEIKEKRLGSLHFDTLTSYNNLAALHQKVGHLDVAEEMFRTSCEGCESTMGKYDKASLNVKGNLGIVLLEQGNIDAGVTLINESLLYFHRVHSLPNEHRWVQKFMRALHASGNVDQDPSPTSLKFAQSTMPAQTQLSIKASELR
jgi:tetratricopeptide (TPR) repeat protein